MSNTVIDFLIKRSDFKDVRWVERGRTEDIALEDGQLLAQIERFALTSNNITYLYTGEMLGYWKYFPAPEAGYGRLPTFATARVVKSLNPSIAAGERLWGYFPIASHLIMQPERISRVQFLDHYRHRRELHPAYNTYRRIDHDSRFRTEYEGFQSALRPLFMTSFLADDFLGERDYLGAGQTVLLSASSRTAIGVAACIRNNRGSAMRIIGLTSSGKRGFVAGLGCYDQVLTYEEIAELDNAIPTCSIDMAGDGDVLARLHHHLGANIVYSMLIGKSHPDTLDPPRDLPGASPAFFFAPAQIEKRIGEWGVDGFETKLSEAWRQYLQQALTWFELVEHEGRESVERVYRELLAGVVDPQQVLSMRL